MNTETRKTRRAIRTNIVAFNLTCPECGYELEAPNGSLIWLAEDLPQDDEIICCDAIMILPKTRARNQRRA